ncbi:MAG TPA: transketolase [Candidatus Baltobacteraceae bacterium]|nr:transketolase [Candidatus Baltobacteraceae bacterium]
MEQMNDASHSSAAFAGRIRRRVLEMICRAKSSHIGSVFSTVDILAVLYDKILRVDPAQPDWPDRDRFILSKGHACAGLYAALAERGFFPATWLEEFFANGGRLAGHATHWGVPGVEASTGSLGHGLSLGAGMALAGKRDGLSYRVFVMLSDGECDEGSTWEAALFAPHHGLENLVAIVDYNKIQSFGRVDDVLGLSPFAAKWESFGWGVCEIDGHDHPQIERALSQIPAVRGKPTCVIANTVKGKGVSFMEDKVLWHYRCPDAEERRLAFAELEGK